MSSSPQQSEKQPQTGGASQAEPRPSAALIFDDPLSLQSSDDTDRGWGEGASGSSGGGAADLARFLDEKPPHHL